MVSQDLVDNATLERQCYGIQMAQAVYGGPRGIWLECRHCSASERIVGSVPREPWETATNKQVAEVFRRHGWTGDGDKMKNAKCPKCNKEAQG